MLFDFHFIRPEWLYGLIPLCLLWVIIKRFPKNQQDWQGVVSSHLYKHLFPSAQQSKGFSGLSAFMGLGALLSLLGAAGPTIEKLPQPVFSVNQGHVVVLDMSLSMRATDIAPDRMTRAKFKAIDLVKNINEGEIGVVAYAGDAFTISPLTEDINTLETLIPSLSPEIMPVRGSDAYAGLTHAADLLIQAGYPNGNIYWITDGIDIDEQQEITQWINNTSIQINVLAVGTSSGAPIKLVNGELLKDSRGSIVIPKLKVGPLVSLSRQSGGKATQITTDESDIERLTENFVPPEAETNNDETKLGGDQWRELGPWLVLVALPFIAYLFRAGLVAVVAISVLCVSASPKPAFADEQQNESPTTGVLSTVGSLFKNADQQGLEAYKNEDFLKAAEEFKDPMWEGSAQYRQGNYEDALAAFEQVDSADSWYNRGNALAKLGELDEASEAYGNALERQPDFKEAQENKDLIDSIQDQESDQNQDGDQNQDDSNQEQQQNDSEQNQDSDQQQESQNDQQNTDEQDSEQDGSDQKNSDPKSNEQQSNDQNQQSNDELSQDESAQDKQDDEQAQRDKEAQQSEQDQQKAIQNAVASEEELTDEEREKQQQIEALLRRVPNDPAFLLQQKMRLEAQKRARQNRPVSQEKQW